MNNVHNDHNLSDYINALTTFTAQLTPTGTNYRWTVYLHAAHFNPRNKR